MTSMGEDAVPAVEAEMSDPEMDEWMNAPAGPYAPALETVEAQDGGAAWERGEEAEGFVRWTLRKSNGFPKVMRWIDSDVEAAIRAPLEERIDHLERLLRDLHAAGEVDGRNALIKRAEAAEERIRELEALYVLSTRKQVAAEAENAKLREALRQACNDLQDGGRPVLEVEADVTLWRALATSSTEATV